MIKKTSFCNNCGRSGHLFHQCKIPITSIGIIAFRKAIDDYEVLLIKRKDSLAFVDFMRGKYNLEDKKYITWQQMNSETNHNEAAKNIVSSILNKNIS